MPDWETPDWKAIVRERMSASGPSCDAREEVIAELAGHLEETYEAALTQGITEDAALEFTLQEVNDWRVLAANIRRAQLKEDPMNERTRTMWLPAMASLAGAALLLLIVQKLGVQPRVGWVQDTAQQKMAMVFYLPWLIALPVFGALGALLAGRSQASKLHRVIAGTAPALAMLGSFAVLLPVSLVLDRTAHLSGFPWGYFALTVLNWVGLPALALLLGALPFLRDSPAPDTQQRPA